MRHFDGMLTFTENYINWSLDCPHTADGVFYEIRCIASHFMNNMDPLFPLAGKEPEAVDLSTWLSPPDIYTKPLVHFRRWNEIGHTGDAGDHDVADDEDDDESGDVDNDDSETGDADEDESESDEEDVDDGAQDVDMMGS